MHQTVFRRALMGATAIACIALAMPAHAQDDTDRDTDGIIVTSTKIPTQIEKTGSSISVVTKEEMEEQQTRQVLDALTTTPGISVSQFGAKGTDSTVRMRGMPGHYTSVLIDGVEVSDPSRSQTAFDFSQLQTVGIDRIEVLRGSQSVLYGGEAVAGAVNIVTERGRGDIKGSAFGEIGSYDTYLVGGGVRGGFDDDRGGINVSAQYLDTSGFSAADENLPGNSEGEDYDNFSSLGRLDYQLTDRIGIKGNFRYAEGTLNYDASSGPYGDDPDVGDDYLQYSGRGAVTFETKDRFFVGEAGVAYSYSKRDGFDNGAPAYYYVGERVTYDFQGTLNFDPDNIIIVGVERNEESYESDTSPAGVDIWTNALFGMYQFSPVENLFLSVGARLDDHEAYGTHDTYRGTAAYRFADTGTTIRGSYSTGFRAPSLFELYGKCCGDPNFGNPNLTPEESKSWDAGIDQSLFGGDMFLSVAYFNIDTENAIQFEGVYGTMTPNYFNKPGESRSRGVETSADWMVNSDLRVNVAYTWNVVQDATGERYDNAPRHSVNFNVNYALFDGRGNVNLNVLHRIDTRDRSNSVRLDDPFVVKLAARYSLLDNLDVTARIENLLDDEYQTEYGYGTSDRAFYAGLTYRF